MKFLKNCKAIPSFIFFFPRRNRTKNRRRRVTTGMAMALFRLSSTVTRLHSLTKSTPPSPSPPTPTVTTTPSELLTFFRDMATMRRMEIAADLLYKAKLIRDFCHLYDGQEAVAVGVGATMGKKVCVITAYRDHCMFLVRGGTLEESFAELMGRRGGCSKGKGGSMHFYNKEGGFYGGHGIVGAQVPLGIGLAFGQKYLKDESVTLAVYGDGAANQGQLFEALISLPFGTCPPFWSARIISGFSCCCFADGMGTPAWRAAKNPNFYQRGDYVPGLKVDGMDAFAVKQACKFAKEHALKNGPIVLEMDTYRYHGHSMSDPGITYRKRDEIRRVRQERDPIENIRRLILAHGVADEKELKEAEAEIRKEVDDAIAKAKVIRF
uniref:pyruvate dehydrogenase (acetyl-transferring) n=1 Tax=Kalanchoe fedtschenkoi TaxID=63787 RepID=A0A7N0V0I6_KALFE